MKVSIKLIVCMLIVFLCGPANAECRCLYERPLCDPQTLECTMICGKEICTPSSTQICNNNGACELGEASATCPNDCANSSSACPDGANVKWGSGLSRCEGNVECLNGCASGQAFDSSGTNQGYAHFVCTGESWWADQQFCDGQGTLPE